MRTVKKVILVLILMIALIGVFYVVQNNSKEREVQVELLNQEKKAAQEESRRIAAETEIQKLIKIQKVRAQAECFNKEVQSDIEIVLLKEIGTIPLYHDKSPQNNWYSEWLINSEIHIFADYRAKLTIPAQYIWAEVSEGGEIRVLYDLSKVSIGSVEIFNVSAYTNRGWFGSSYSAEEIVALISVLQDRIYTSVNTFENLQYAKENLVCYIQDIVKMLNITNVEIKKAS